ncbi:MAG: PEGA domain-containing protein, partial [Candidatus Poribacteria bacterium]
MKYVIISAFVIMGIIAVLYFYVFTGIITISSLRPLDAIIKIDGEEVGTTPLKLRVKTGSHTVMAYKDGFEKWEGIIDVKSFKPQTLSVKLRFLLRSEPSGADVKINGKDYGVTDLPLDLPPGVYTFEFTKKGYNRTKFMAEIPRDVSMPLPVAPMIPVGSKTYQEDVTSSTETSTTLASQKGFGSIQITSKPDAQVYLDGDFMGETPITLTKIPVGSYVLKLSREGYRDLRQTVYV